MELRTTHRIGDLYQAVQEITNATSPDLTLRQLLVLLGMDARTSSLTQQALAEEHALRKSTVSRIVAHLAGDTGDVRRADGMGLLRVSLDPSDLRNRHVSLSGHGEKVLARAAGALGRPG